MSIPEDFVQELKSRTDIADVISDYVTLKRSGRTLMGVCPFHNDRSPSFSVSRENGFFYCFGCGAGGDVITFLRKIENLDYMEALRKLASRAGMTIPENKGYDQGLMSIKSRIYEANKEAGRFYFKQLYSPDGKNALEYLKKRQISETMIRKFGLGYSPNNRFALVNHLKSKGFSDNELITANLANQSRNGYPFDRFSDRVMFPIFDLSGRVIAFGGRIMSDIKPKYLNTSDTPVFNKSRNLFGLNTAKNHANGTLILVEGYMDVISLHQAGFENAVATLGTALTNEQAMMIKRYCEDVVICYDSDEAGQKATQRAIGILRSTGLNIRILTVPDGKDPDEFMKSHGDKGVSLFRRLLEKSGNDIEYRLNKMREGLDLENNDQRVQYLTNAAELISELDNPVTQDVYLTKLSNELDVQKSALKSIADKAAGKRMKKKRIEMQRQVEIDFSAVKDTLNKEKHLNLRAANAEEALIALMILNPDTAKKIAEEFPTDKFVTTFNRNIYTILCERIKNDKGITMSDISGDFSLDEIGRIAKMLISHQREDDPYSAAKIYTDILYEESERMTPEQIASADNDSIMEQLRKMKMKKQ